MNKKTSKTVLLVLYLILGVYSAGEIICSYKFFLDPSGGIPNVYIGLQVIMILVLVPSISGTIFGVRELLIPSMTANLIYIVIYVIFSVLIVTAIIGTSQKWLCVLVLICKMPLFVVLAIFACRFYKMFVKNERLDEINMENDYTFRRFGKLFDYIKVPIQKGIKQIFASYTFVTIKSREEMKYDCNL